MSRLTMFVSLGALLAAVLTAIERFRASGPELGPWSIELALILVLSVIVWLIGGRATRQGGRPGVPALVFAILGVLSIAVFWLGLPPVFAGGGAALGLVANERGSKGIGIVAIVLAALTVLLAIFIAFAG